VSTQLNAIAGAVVRRGTTALSPKRAAFVTEYLRDFNGTQAAIRAGYSAHCAQETASRLLSNAIISGAISKAAEESRTEAVMVLREAQEIATQIARDAERSARDRLAALELLSRFNGWDRPARIEVAAEDATGLAQLREMARAMTPAERAEWLEMHAL